MSVISSLPDRPLTDGELSAISDATAGGVIPATSVEFGGYDGELYSAFVHLTEERVLSVGYHPIKSEWVVVREDDIETDPDVTLKRVNEWVAEVYQGDRT